MADRTQLIKSGVRALWAFGYPLCNEGNILTDRVYSRCFRGLLSGIGSEVFGGRSEDTAAACEGLLGEIKANERSEA